MVVVIIGILSAMAVAGYRSYMEKYRLDVSARKLALAFAQAQGWAEKTGSRHFVVFTAPNKYAIWRQSDATSRVYSTASDTLKFQDSLDVGIGWGQPASTSFDVGGSTLNIESDGVGDGTANASCYDTKGTGGWNNGAVICPGGFGKRPAVEDGMATLVIRRKGQTDRKRAWTILVRNAYSFVPRVWLFEEGAWKETQ